MLSCFKGGSFDGTGYRGRSNVEWRCFRWYWIDNIEPLERQLLTVWSIKSAIRKLPQPLKPGSLSNTISNPTTKFLVYPSL